MREETREESDKDSVTRWLDCSTIDCDDERALVSSLLRLINERRADERERCAKALDQRCGKDAGDFVRGLGK